MPRHFKVDQILSEKEWLEYKAFLERRPTPTITEDHEWFGERGFNISRGAVWKHRRNFDQNLSKLNESTEFSRGIMRAAREGKGVEDIAEANLLQLQIRLSEALFRDEDLEAGDLMKLAMSLRGSVATKKELDEMKRRTEEVLRNLQNKAEKKAGGVTVEEIAAARKDIFG